MLGCGGSSQVRQAVSDPVPLLMSPLAGVQVEVEVHELLLADLSVGRGGSGTCGEEVHRRIAMQVSSVILRYAAPGRSAGGGLHERVPIPRRRWVRATRSRRISPTPASWRWTPTIPMTAPVDGSDPGSPATAGAVATQK